MVWRLGGIAAVLFALLPFGSRSMSAEGIPPPPVVGAKTIGYGVSTLAAPDRLDRTKSMGFNWVKIFGAWNSIQPGPNEFYWPGIDGDIDRATSRGLRILLRVDQPPTWANGTDAYNAPPTNDAYFGDFMKALAARYKGRVQAYEIWNEPNTSIEWGNKQPDPAKFTRMLRDLYPKVKSVDPNAIIVTGGVATTGDGGAGDAWGDLAYLRAIYENGGKGYFDAIGSHPYGGPYPPEVSKGEASGIGVYFRRSEEHRALAESYGDNPAIWPTEVGWLHNQNAGSCDLNSYDPYHGAWQLSEQTQADYLVRAFKYAAEHWPWAGPIFIYNLDFSIDTWRVTCDPNRFFSLVRGNGSPLASFNALKSMQRFESGKPTVDFSGIPPVVGDVDFEIDWTGNDSGSGVASYDVQYRKSTTTTWTTAIMNTAEPAVEIIGDDRTTYILRVRAQDWAGNFGDWQESPPVFVSRAGYLIPSSVQAVYFGSASGGEVGSIQVRNLGGKMLNWTAQSDNPLITLGTSSGHLGMDQSAPIGLIIPGGLPSGDYSATVSFTSDSGQTDGPISVNVQVGTPPRQVFLPSIAVRGLVN